MKMDAPDQRIKLLLPPSDGVFPELPDSDEWYRQWLALPKAQRPVMRTYTHLVIHKSATPYMPRVSGLK
ncbi:siderophore-interacting protein [Symbiopectobacterium sp. Eva_TO]